jgi:transcription elongation factor Elf1
METERRLIMKDIKLLEQCPHCSSFITLMESINVENGKLMLVKRCLKCGQYPVTEVAEIKQEEK